jgi:hypothetical protein
MIVYHQVDEAVIKTVINVLTAEEEAVGLQQPSGIGRRPWPLSVNYHAHGKFNHMFYKLSCCH